MGKHPVRSGMIDQRSRATTKRRDLQGQRHKSVAEDDSEALCQWIEAHHGESTFEDIERLDLKEYLREHEVEFEESEDLAEVIPQVDAVYMTRIQDEYDLEGESKRIDYSRFHFKVEYLQLLKPNAIIMHPLPRRQELPTEIDQDRRAVYWRQVRNGMWVRVALIAKIFRVDGEIWHY